MWSDRKIGAGEEWKGDIDERLEAADVILLLISPDFIASDYCYDVEMKRAMRRHDEGGVCVIPILLRAVNWRDAPFGKLQPLPTNERPVTSWSNRDEAFTNIAEGIQTRLEEFTNVGGASPDKIEDSLPPPITAPIVDFVQRRDADNRDIAEYLTKELTPSGNKLVTLCGLGGVGKTTLAFEVARKWEKAYGARTTHSPRCLTILPKT
jgi:hypothetical protein